MGGCEVGGGESSGSESGWVKEISLLSSVDSRGGMLACVYDVGGGTWWNGVLSMG